MAEWPMIDRTLWPKPASRKTPRQVQLADGAGVRLGPATGGDHPDQPGLPLAVRLLQRELLHPEHGPAPGGRW